MSAKATETSEALKASAQQKVDDTVVSIQNAPQALADAVQAKAQEAVDGVKAAPRNALLNVKAGIEAKQQDALDAVEAAKQERDALRDTVRGPAKAKSDGRFGR